MNTHTFFCGGAGMDDDADTQVAAPPFICSLPLGAVRTRFDICSANPQPTCSGGHTRPSRKHGSGRAVRF